ncbi:MAG: S-adenosylmethionine:tRNA ribosyltransferase-isomerase [Chitinophagaceae bacterium]
MKNHLQNISIKEYNYDLSPHSIAKHPTSERDESRLLIFRKGRIEEDIFQNLDDHLPAGATLVLNNTKVIEARIFFAKPTRGIIEIFCLAPYEPSEIDAAMQQSGKVKWKCLIGGASKWKRGQLLKKTIFLDKPVALAARFIEKHHEDSVIEFSWNTEHPFAEVLHAAGVVPLPPYIKRSVEVSDSYRYQTIFAKLQGSVAAPTAALHFTERVFIKLSHKNICCEYLTLHVGSGTFKPVKSATIAEHSMHAETFTVSLKTLKTLAGANEIIAVGTTSLRTLESLHWLGVKFRLNKSSFDYALHQWEAYELAHHNITFTESLNTLVQFMEQTNQDQISCRTSLMIIPGYSFKSARGLITNFHQPKSTLLLLVAAFIGEDQPTGQAGWKEIYNYALQNNYRFLSYGDSSLLWRNF